MASTTNTIGRREGRIEIWRPTPASRAERAAEQLDKEAIIIAVGTRLAKAQKHALEMNDNGDYRGARSLAETEVNILREVAGDVVDAVAASSELQRIALELADMMPSSRKKQMLYDSYRRRRSR